MFEIQLDILMISAIYAITMLAGVRAGFAFRRDRITSVRLTGLPSAELLPKLNRSIICHF